MLNDFELQLDDHNEFDLASDEDLFQAFYDLYNSYGLLPYFISDNPLFSVANYIFDFQPTEPDCLCVITFKFSAREIEVTSKAGLLNILEQIRTRSFEY